MDVDIVANRTSLLGQPSKESDIELSSEISEEKNKRYVKCKHCPSTILKPGSAKYVEHKFELPMMEKKKIESDNSVNNETKCEDLVHYWEVDDMYSFENIGFSKTVDNLKYLACADCDIGPVGYYNMENRICYIALARVRHVD